MDTDFNFILPYRPFLCRINQKFLLTFALLKRIMVIQYLDVCFLEFIKISYANVNKELKYAKKNPGY